MFKIINLIIILMKMKSLFAVLLALLLPMTANAMKGTACTNVIIDGIKYALVYNYSTTDAIKERPVGAYVIANNEKLYAGNFVIPNSVDYELLKWGTEDYGETYVAQFDVLGIEISAFKDCKDLISVYLPSTIRTFAVQDESGAVSTLYDCNSYPFIGCDNLSSIEVDAENTVFTSGENSNAIIRVADGTIVVGCRNTQIPLSVKAIGDNAFNSCKGLSFIEIPKSVATIYPCAFKNCSGLKYVDLSNVSAIYEGAFNGCSGMTDLYVRLDHCPFLENQNVFGDYIENATLHVPASCVDEYKTTAPWNGFGNIVAIKDTDPSITEKCAIPSISFEDGKLVFESETTGAECHYEIKNDDVKNGIGKEIELTAAYQIFVYATKDGYNDSDVKTAMLYWVNVDPIPTGIVEDEIRVNTNAILVQNNSSIIIVTGVGDGTDVMIYNISGQLIGQGKATGNRVKIGTVLSEGDVCIVKIGEKSVKYLLR